MASRAGVRLCGLSTSPCFYVGSRLREAQFESCPDRPPRSQGRKASYRGGIQYLEGSCSRSPWWGLAMMAALPLIGAMVIPPAGDMGYPIDRDMANRSPGQSRQNGASYGSLPGRGPGVRPLSALVTETGIGSEIEDAESRRSDERNLSRPRNGRTASGQTADLQEMRRAADGPVCAGSGWDIPLGLLQMSSKSRDMDPFRVAGSTG